MLNSKKRFFLEVVLSLGALLLGTSAGYSADGSRLAMRLYGGLGYLSLAEMNDGIRGALNDITFNRTMGENSVYNDLRMGTDFGADLAFFLTPKFGVSLGAEDIRGRKSSRYTVLPPQPGFVSGEPILTSLAVKANLFLRLPLSGKLNFTASAGAGYYHASLDLTYAWEIAEFGPQTTERIKVSAGRLGFQAGIGLEYNLSSWLAVFFEASGRLARFQGLEGTVQYNQNPAKSAKLYSLEQIVDTTWFPVLDAWPTTPAFDDLRNVREATIDLSGGSALLGFAFYF